MLAAAQPPHYPAQLYLGYDGKAHDHVAHWLDRFGAAGARVIASGERHERTLVLNFPYVQGPAATPCCWGAQPPDGGWSTFASYRLRRLTPGLGHAAAPPR